MPPTAAGASLPPSGGSHYLSGNTYRNVGTTNISANLRADLKKKTTFGPLGLIQ